MEEMKDLIKQEWKKTEKRFSTNCLNTFYPLQESEIALFETPPVVDVSIVCLAKNITLPMEDSASFKDIMDIGILLNLKKGAACRSAIALTSVAIGIRVWTQNIAAAINEGVPKEDFIHALDEVQMSAHFIGEAVIDSINF